MRRVYETEDRMNRSSVLIIQLYFLLTGNRSGWYG